MLDELLLVVIMAGWLYWIAAWLLTYDFFRRRQGDGVAGFAPTVSVLKPVRGLDAEAFENFASFCGQDYPGYEILFGVADPADPVVPLIESLQREHPEHPIRLVIAPAVAANRKVGLLQNLAAVAHGEVLVVSDSDMRVTPDYLQRVVGPLSDEGIGLVTCPYRAERALTLTARLEALHMGVTFLPGVMIARHFLAMRFAMGATLALRRADLDSLGGFAVVADYLADDFQIGVRVAALGKRVRLSDYVVVSVLGQTTFHDQWRREVRWARTNRVCRPLEYPALLLTFTTSLSAALVPLSGYAPMGWRVLLASLLLRWLVAWAITGYTGDCEGRRWLFWLPLRDLLSALTWCFGAVGRRVAWRGEVYEIRAGGKLRPLEAPLEQPYDAGHAWPPGA